MNAQLDWLKADRANEARRILVDTPRAANADPVTSHIAADRIKAVLGEQQQHALALVKAFPGKTSAELADIAARRGDGEYTRLRMQLGRRLAELKGFFARQGEPRTCTKVRKECVTWWPL